MKLVQLYKTLGPGLIWAAGAIGVSHLVQSTSAGAHYGYYLIWAIILSNLIKYPFFAVAPIYTSITGNSLLDGYKQINKYILPLFGLLTFISMFIVQAAVTYVCAAILKNILPFEISILTWVIILLAGCTAIILVGGFNSLESIIKIILVLLLISTVVAVLLSLFNVAAPSIDLNSLNTFQWSNHLDIIFLIALIGWMPCPLGFSVAHSLCILEKHKTDKNFVLTQSLLDFRVGYIATTIIAVLFLILGANVMYVTGEQFSASGATFAGQFINLYVKTLGNWSYIIIALAAFTVMFSTVLACLDLYPRMLTQTIALSTNKTYNPSTQKLAKTAITLILVAGVIVFLTYFTGNMKTLVTFATTLSFTVAPILAWFNYKLITGTQIQQSYKINIPVRYFMLFSIVAMALFSLWYIQTVFLY